MGSVKVTVYGRAKPSNRNSFNQEYEIKTSDNEDQITFISNKLSSGKKTYRFKKIFAEDASQEEVFEAVAKPVIKNVLNGYNGTIFTYGQTGSGKTYTMTGDLEGWVNPGLIPRTVQEIFKQKERDTPISITYCEIYNEHVYDLIRADPLDPDVPQVSLLEDSSGMAHFRNLSVHLVGSAFEALQLLVRGDANKMVAETNSNARSSRSHVIFSIGLKFPHPTEASLCLKPVLYLVDLAGSEKLSKCKTPSNNPLETRYINLSLHYLEQVLIALRQPGRNHIPYRNSLMTALLRNSLGGNCITAMIATFSLSLDDLDETLQTCRFAERIALIKNEIKLHELADPQKEIVLLRKENDKLKAQLKIMGFTQAGEELTERDRGKCAEMVKNFIKDNDVFDLPLSDVKRIECCFQLMRDELLKRDPKQSALKNIDNNDSVLDLLKKKSLTLLKNELQKARIKEENRVKFQDVNNRRKRNPMELPKINVTYKRWKSTEEMTENRNNEVKKFSSKEIKIVETHSSDSSSTSQRPLQRKSESSIQKVEDDTREHADKKRLETYILDGCFVKMKESETSTKEGNSSLDLKEQSFESGNELRETSKTDLPNAVSSVYIKADDYHSSLFPVTEQSPLSSEEKITFGEIRKLISVGIQVEENVSTDENMSTDVSTDEVSISNVDSASVNSFDAEIIAGKSLPLTGDKEVDEEIIKFYKSRYNSLKNKQQ